MTKHQILSEPTFICHRRWHIHNKSRSKYINLLLWEGICQEITKWQVKNAEHRSAVSYEVSHDATSESLKYWTGVSLNHGKGSQTLIIQRKKYWVRVIVALFWRTIFFAPGTPQQSSLLDRIGRNCQNNMGSRIVIVGIWEAWLCNVDGQVCMWKWAAKFTVQQTKDGPG